MKLRPVMLHLNVLLAGLLLAAGAHAQSADPTAPPPGLVPLAEGEAAPAAPVGPELQQILVSREPGGRRLAVISGETVRQGARYQGAIVETIGANEVVLRRGGRREVLKLFAHPQGAVTPRAAARIHPDAPAAADPARNGRAQ
ncbi:hypothetical protein [Pseudoduganella lurida]|uniref:hypothetical protein n=1 Tax=Pseudoduganella lurida TaxID=1036180 RepID=UPI0018F3BFF5|nr:hypothetical protein [Pseudoduganella lurida]